MPAERIDMTEEQRNEYMKRLEHEYERFKVSMYTSSPADVFENAETIINMKYAYDYLRSNEISEDALEYIMKAMNPLMEVAKTQEAMDAVTYFDNPVKFAVVEIYDKSLFDDGETEQYVNRIPIRFHRKMCSIDEIAELPRLGPDDKYRVEKVVNLSPNEFERFSNSLIADDPVVVENKEHMWMDRDDECWHCLLVKDMGSERGLLIESEGYDYARYAAYVQDTRELDLKGIPVEDRTKPKGRQRTIAKQHTSPER